PRLARRRAAVERIDDCRRRAQRERRTSVECRIAALACGAVIGLATRETLDGRRAVTTACDECARRARPHAQHITRPWTPRGWSRTLHQGRSEEHTSELQSRQYLVCR